MIERRSRKLMVALTPGEHKALVQIARNEGEAMSVVVRRLIRDATHETITPPTATPTTPTPASPKPSQAQEVSHASQ